MQTIVPQKPDVVVRCLCYTSLKFHMAPLNIETGYTILVDPNII